MMMKKIGLALVLLFGVMFVSCGGAGVKKTDWENHGLKGSVKQVKECVRNMPDNERSFIAKDRDTTGIGEYDIVRVYEFNEGGYLTELRSTSSNAKLYEKYLYDKDGNLTMIEMYVDDKLVRTFIHRYSASGRLTSISSVNAESKKVDGSTFFEYDKNGNVIKEINKDAEGNKMGEIVYKNDAKGRHISMMAYDPNGKSSDIETLYDYDNQNNITKIETKDMLLKNSTSQELLYYDKDEKGNWTRRETIFMQNRVQEVKRTHLYYE